MQEEDPIINNEDNTFDVYKEEHIRLGTLKDETESIWEDRTYQLAAGGLSLTFAVFSFLMSGENGVVFRWPMAVIWGGYVLCLIVNYISQHISAIHLEKLQILLYEDRKKEIPYSEERQIERGKKFDSVIVFLNVLTEIVLVMDIIFTIVYTCILFTNK